MDAERVHVDGETDTAVLEELGTYAHQQSYATESFVDALLERESNYPTGLDISTHGLGIAIPHADPEHVNDPAVILGLPKTTIPFTSMDDPDVRIDVDVVVLLLVTDTEGYSTFLSNLTNLFQDSEFAEAAHERDAHTLLELIFERCIEGATYDPPTDD